MSFNVFLVAALLLVTCPLASADDTQMDDICGDIDYNVKDPSTEFTFQDQFTVHVEAVLPEMNRVTNSWMRYNSNVKILKINERSSNWDYATYYDYNYHQTLEYDFLDTGRGSCKVIDDTMRERLGFFLVPEPQGGPGEAPLASGIFRLTGPSGFGQDDIRLKKTQNVYFRSLKATKYESCQKITTSDGSKAILKVTHLVSNDKLTRTVTEDGTVPLQATFEGKFVSGKKSGDPVSHTYNFFHYSTSAIPDDFQTPEGIVCEGRKTKGDFPLAPAYISFGQEIHDSKRNSKMLTVNTLYDREFNFVQEQFFDPAAGREAIVRFDDFYAGLTYTLDPNTMLCDIKNITDAATVNDYIKTSDGKAKMMTPEQFWDSEGIEYHYNGMKHFRGLETEAWIGKDYETGKMYEWYFQYGVTYSVSSKSKEGEYARVPYKRMFWPDDTDRVFTTYFFQVDLTEPAIVSDLSACYLNEMKFVSLYVPELTRKRATTDQTIIVRRAVKSLTKALNVPFTRIAKPSILFRGDKGYLTFFLLGRPPFASDVVTQHAQQPSIDEAMEKLKKISGEGGSLVFNVGSSKQYVKSEPKFEEITPSKASGDQGYSAGAMAGLSIAMIVIGLAAGGGGGYWFFIRR